MIRLLRLYDVLAATGYAKSTLYALIAQGLWPKPVKTNRSSTWPDYESDAINAARIAGASDDEIRQLVRELEAARTADNEVRITTHKEVADHGHRQAASKTPCTRNDIKLAYKPPKTFIPINEDYALGADAHAWHILKRHRDKDNYRWEPTAKYATLEQCVNALAERAVHLSGAQSLAELLAESQRVVSVICGALQPHFKVERRS